MRHVDSLTSMVLNSVGDLQWHEFNGITFPCIAPKNKAIPSDERCWTSCLWSASIGYPCDEGLGRLGRMIGRMPPFGPWSRAVLAGSLPLSTTLRALAEHDALLGFAVSLREHFPDHPIAVRHLHADQIEAFADHDFTILPARVVYLLNRDRHARSSSAKADAKALKRHRDRIALLQDHDFDEDRVREALALYQHVYRTIHSKRNANYTQGFLAWARRTGTVTLVGLSCTQTNRLLAFAGLHCKADAMSVPMLGFVYDDHKTTGVYRMLVSHLCDVAGQRNATFNFSSGAGEFKRRRGFEPVLEWVAIAPARGKGNVSDRCWLAVSRRLAARLSLERLLQLGC